MTKLSISLSIKSKISNFSKCVFLENFSISSLHEKVSKEKGYSAVIENTAMVLYIDSSNDLTDEVVKAFEKEK